MLTGKRSLNAIGAAARTLGVALTGFSRFETALATLELGFVFLVLRIHSYSNSDTAKNDLKWPEYCPIFEARNLTTNGQVCGNQYGTAKTLLIGADLGVQVRTGNGRFQWSGCALPALSTIFPK